VLSFSKNRLLAEKSVDFAFSKAGQVILAEYDYCTEPVE
jgi:hypothetical protein